MRQRGSTALLAPFFLATSTAIACKPCPSDLLAYSMFNNRTVFVGRVLEVGKAPADIVRINEQQPGLTLESDYSIPVRLQVLEAWRNSASGPQAIPGKTFSTESRHSPPCKSIVKVEVGRDYLFFPEDFGNCSKFAFAIEQGAVDGRPLSEIKKLPLRKGL